LFLLSLLRADSDYFQSLLFTINDLLVRWDLTYRVTRALLTLGPLQDLTRVESGHETTFNEPFDLPSVITEATNLYKYEAQRKGLDFEIDLACDLRMVVGDSGKVRTMVANLTANARKRHPSLISLVCGPHLR
jgi:signal transduction histidine kinase